MNWLIYVAVFMPMLGGAASFLIGLRNKNARDWFAIAVSALTLVCTLLLPDPETLIHGETFTFTQSVRVTATSLREQYEPSEEAEFRF